MAGTKSTYLKNKILDAIFNATPFSLAGDPYVSLHTADPGATGADEVAGGSYARVQAAFSAAASGAVSNSGNIDHTGMPAATVTHAGLWDASSGGNFLWGGPLGSSIAIGAGNTHRIPTGDFDATDA